MNDAAIVDRILSFDTDGDGRVAAEELPERMEALLPRLDADGDGFVTAEEVRKRVNGIPPVARGGVITGQVARPPALADVVNDLKLPEAVRLHALQIVQGYMVPQGANDPASPDLAVVYAAMRHLLDDEDYGNFVAAVTRHGARRFVVSNSVSTNPPVRERGSTPAPPSPPR